MLGNPRPFRYAIIIVERTRANSHLVVSDKAPRIRGAHTHLQYIREEWEVYANQRDSYRIDANLFSPRYVNEGK